MQPLGGIDALFLHLETAETPMHVGALHLLDAPAGDRDFFAAVGRHIAARLGTSPVFTRRLCALPLAVANPLWVDGAAFAGCECLSVHPDEPLGANALPVGPGVIYAAAFPRTRARLEQRGLDIRTVEVSELAKAEGAITCCSLVLATA